MVAHRTLRGDVAASSDDVGVWDESASCSRQPTGTLINATTDRVAWDRKTGEASTAATRTSTACPPSTRG